jgi:hypothetical protein
MDLERAVTFTGYDEMQDPDPIIDEEHWNWTVLLTRIFCFLLVFVIIVCVALEAITPKFLVLAAIICGLLVIVLIATYIDPRKWWSIICRMCGKPPQEPTPATVHHPHLHPHSNRSSHQSTPSSARSRPPTIQATVVSTQAVDNPIQMVSRNSDVARR